MSKDKMNKKESHKGVISTTFVNSIRNILISYKRHKKIKYEISAQAYLNRARKRLDEKKYESLFYAAFELRCGIESRMQEYLGAQEHISKKKKKGWQIVKLGKDLEQAFKIGDKIVELTMEHNNGKVVILRYTPVTSKLIKYAEKLGDLMHAMRKVRYDDIWWKEIRLFLEETYLMLKNACEGELLGPPLLKRGTKQVTMVTSQHTKNALKMHSLAKIGGKTQMNVEYRDVVY